MMKNPKANQKVATPRQEDTIERQITLRKKACNQLKALLGECRIENPRDKKILEIGFKNGLFLDECQKAGLIPTGIEINEEYFKVVKSGSPDLHVLWYDGGSIPLPDESFDLVVSFSVLEHVGSIEHIFSESIRMLKSGGIMYHTCPNYQSFYEGHYRIIWLPFLNRTLGRLYLKLLRRYTELYETLNIVKPKAIARRLKHRQNDITVISLGQAEFIKNFNLQQIEKVNQRKLQQILKMLLRLKVIKKCVLALICAARLYYPITVIARKN